MGNGGDPQIDFLIDQVAGRPRAMVALARTLLIPRGMLAKAGEVCEAAIKLAPEDAEVRALAQLVRSRIAGRWYFTMVEDHARHALYSKALRSVVSQGMTVLDVGAGTGLFAMLAARAGAAKVIACERNPDVAAAACEIVERNGFSDRVTIIHKDSRNLEIGVDLEEPADVLLWDNLSNDLLSEGGLVTIEDARRRLLKPHAAIMPEGCEIRLALVEAGPATAVEMGMVDGFDMTPFNRFRPTQFTLGRSKFSRRSDAATIFQLDFAAADAVEPERAAASVTASGGRVDGIAQWLRFRLADGVFYDTGDDEGVTAFGLQYHAVEPFEAEAGQQIRIEGAHDRQGLWFWINGMRADRH